MRTKKNLKKKTAKPEIKYVSGNDFYIYELLIGELPGRIKTSDSSSNKTAKKQIKKTN